MTVYEPHQSTKQVLQYFTYDHLPPDLAAVSRPICELAFDLASLLPPGPEVTVGIRKLLEGKDALCRAALAARTPGK